MAATPQKDKFAVISKFESLCKKHGHVRAPLYKYKEQWAADALVQSYGLSGTYELMDYYFSINDNPHWTHFTVRAGDLYVAMKAKAQDDAYRAKQREIMKELLDES